MEEKSFKTKFNINDFKKLKKYTEEEYKQSSLKGENIL